MPKTTHNKPTIQEAFLTFKKRTKPMRLDDSCLLLEAVNMIRYANKSHQVPALEILAKPLFVKLGIVGTCHCGDDSCPHWEIYESQTEYDDDGNPIEDEDGEGSCKCGSAFDCKGLNLSIKPSYLNRYISRLVYPT